MKDSRNSLPLQVEWAESEIARSSSYRRQSGSRCLTASGASVVACVDARDRQRASVAGLLDLGMLPHTGYRGSAAAEWLAQQQFPIPLRPNQAATCADGCQVLRLSPREFWLLGSISDLGARIAAMPTVGDQTPANCYPLFCGDSHSWLLLTGSAIADVMAKLCAVDLRPAAFPPGAIAQTSVARTGAIVAHLTLGGLPAFAILCDMAASDYLWTVLLDAVQEFDGGAIGLDCLRD